MAYDECKLSKFVDDFLIDNINNMSSDFIKNQYNIMKLSINDYFPIQNNITFKKLKIDEISRYSITLPKKADDISKIIQTYCYNFNKPIIITDGTAGVGGNVLSFCKHGFIVNAVEIDKDRYECLLNNIKEYNYNILSSHNCDYLEKFDRIKQDVIFIDPPWGGLDYKKNDNITIKLGNINIETLCNKIIEKQLAKLTVLKLPYNYNLNYIKNVIYLPFTIFKLKNILLVIIFNSN